jgi:mRNA-decapping enzyme 1B
LNLSLTLFSDICDSSNHVAFYTYNPEESEWEKTDVEGAFFIYSRNAEPFYSVFIHNRLNTMPLVEPITSHIELQSQPPFLLYRNERSRIRGFWFYNASECVRIGELIGRLVKECEAKVSGQQSMVNTLLHKQPNANVDIFTLLSKAQEDFNNTGGTAQMKQPQNIFNFGPPQPHQVPQQQQQQQHHHPMHQAPQQPDVTSSVMNFFAAAKQPGAPASDVPIFKRIMSAPANPVHVEQIEKQHRAITPLNNLLETGEGSQRVFFSNFLSIFSEIFQESHRRFRPCCTSSRLRPSRPSKTV